MSTQTLQEAIDRIARYVTITDGVVFRPSSWDDLEGTPQALPISPVMGVPQQYAETLAQGAAHLLRFDPRQCAQCLVVRGESGKQGALQILRRLMVQG